MAISARAARIVTKEIRVERYVRDEYPHMHCGAHIPSCNDEAGAGIRVVFEGTVACIGLLGGVCDGVIPFETKVVDFFGGRFIEGKTTKLGQPLASYARETLLDRLLDDNLRVDPFRVETKHTGVIGDTRVHVQTMRICPVCGNAFAFAHPLSEEVVTRATEYVRQLSVSDFPDTYKEGEHYDRRVIISPGGEKITPTWWSEEQRYARMLRPGSTS